MARLTSSIYLGSDNVVQIDGLADHDGSYQNDATVVVESVKDSDGSAVSGVTVPITMSYVAGSNGKYEGTVPDDEAALLTEGDWYDLIIKATSSSGLVRRFKEPAKATYGLV